MPEDQTSSTTNLVIRKLENFTRLSGEDRDALERVSSAQIRRYGAREDIIREGDAPGGINLMLEGWACRYKRLEDGRRQILAYLVPGDFCDLRVFVLNRMDHSIGTLTPATVAVLHPDSVRDLIDRYPRISRALEWSTLVEEAIAREWLVNVGQRTAHERMAHILCEMLFRLRAVGLAEGNCCELPVTQAELADTLGLSHVHVNRTLQDLRRDGLISLRGKWLTIPDLSALQRAALFNADYLHLERDGRSLDTDSHEPT